MAVLDIAPVRPAERGLADRLSDAFRALQAARLAALLDRLPDARLARLGVAPDEVTSFARKVVARGA